MRKIFLLTIIICASVSIAFAGNPDRQGEAGAYELLMNPWARSAGLHTINTSSITGVEAMRLNPAGLGKVVGTEIAVSHTFYLVGTDIGLNAAGFAQNVGELLIDILLIQKKVLFKRLFTRGLLVVYPLWFH